MLKENPVSSSTPVKTILTAIMVISFALPKYQTQAVLKDQLGFSFETKSESYTVSVGRPWWFVKLVLSKENYSKDNLEKIFRYFMEKYPDKHTALTVDVFADSESYERFINTREFSTVFSDKEPEPITKENWHSPHASFLRACDNEFYNYSPDLENPVMRERILLKGRWTVGPELNDCK